VVERDTLKENNEELKCSQLAQEKRASGKTFKSETDSDNINSTEIKYMKIVII
jgi:hypothetical protein